MSKVNRKVNPITNKEYSNPTEGNIQNQSAKPVNPMTGLPYMNSFVPTGEAVTVNPNIWDEYKRLSKNPFATDPSMEQSLATNQTKWEQAKNAVVGTGKNILGGVLDAIGGWDMSDTVGMVAGVDKDYGNWFHETAKKILENSEETNPIYEQNAGSFSPSDPAWWFNQAKSLGTTIGFAGEALAEQLALSSLTGGTLNEVSLAKKLEALKDITSAGKKAMAKDALFGAFKGIQEATVNGYQTFDETKKKFTDEGFSDEEATKFASIAASEGFKKEIGPLMGLNALQYGTLAYNPVTKKTVSAFSGIENKTLREALSTATEIGSEGLEEGWQTIASKEGKYKADLSAGLTTDKTFSQRMEEYLSNAEVWNSFVGGMFGGAMFKGLGEVKNIVQNNSQEKAELNFYNNYKKGLQGVTLDYINQIKKAQEDKDFNKVNSLKREMSVMTALQSYHLDNINEDKGAYLTHVKTLEGLQEAANSNDLEALSRFNLKEEDIPSIISEMPSMISEAKKIKDIYDSLKNTNDSSVLVPLTYRRYLVDKLSEDINKYSSEVEGYKSSIEDYNRLSEAGKTIFDNTYNLDILQTEEARFKKALAEAKNDEVNIINSILENIAIQKTIANNQITAAKETYKNSSVNVINNDEAIIASLPVQSTIKQSLKGKYVAENELLSVRKELALLSDKEFQVGNKKDKFKKLIDSVESIEELNQIKKEVKGDKTLEAKIKAKEESIIAKSKGQELVNNNKEEVLDNSFVSAVEENIPDNINTSPEKPENLNKERQAIVQEVINNVPFTLVEEEKLFEPLEINNNVSQDYKDSVAKGIKDYVDNFSSEKNILSTDVDFKDFIKDIIKHTSKEEADRNFNVLKLGWELNNFKPSDYNDIYKSVFGDRKDIALDLFNLAKNGLVPKTEQEVLVKNEATLNKIDQVQKVDVDTTGEVIYKHANKFKTVSPNLKLAIVSMNYTSEITEENGVVSVEFKNDGNILNIGTDVDSRDLLNPNKYNAGTKLRVAIPSDIDNIIVSEWNNHSKKSVSFSTWVASNNIDPNSDAYISKVPIIVYSEDNKPVAFIHDTDWYNPINVGLSEDSKERDKIIAEAKEELLAFRKHIIENGGSTTIEITSKKPGSKVNSPELITINEANPEAIIGYANASGNIVTKDGLIKSEQLLNVKELTVGDHYDLRQTGIIEVDGKKLKQYIALSVFNSNITELTQSSIVEALRVHLAQHDADGRIMPVNERNQIRDAVKQTMGLDLYDKQDIEKYLNHFITTVKAEVNSKDDIYNVISSNDRVNNLTPFMAIQKGDVVLGIKGMKMSGNSNVRWVYADSMKGKDPTTAASMINSALLRISQQDFLPKMYQSVSRESLQQNNNIVFIDKNRNIIQGKPYNDYLKDNMKTNVKGFNIGTADNPVYATFVQPVINFSYNKVEKDTSIISETPSEVNEETLTDDLLKQKEEFERLGININDLIGDLQKGKGIFEPNYSKDTDESVKRIKDQITKLGIIPISDRNNIIKFIARSIEAQVDVKYKSSVSKNNILEVVKDTFEERVNPQKHLAISKKQTLQELYDKGYTQMKPYIESLDKIIDEIQLVEDNWNEFVEEALQEVYKQTGLVETNKNIIQLSGDLLKLYESEKIILSEEEVDILNKVKKGDKSLFREAAEIYNNVSSFDTRNLSLDILEIGDEVIEAGDERASNYSKTSIEENGKDSVSYVFKRFLSQIPEYNKDGTVKIGFAGSIVYPGFDHYFNRVGQILTSPIEVRADYNSMIERLNLYADNQPWVKDLIERLEKSDEQIKAAFVYNFAVHALSMKFVMHSFNRETGNYTLKVYDTNANEVIRVLQNQWYENMKVSSLVEAKDGMTYINKETANQLISEFDTWNNGNLPSPAEAKKWLGKFGIALSEETINELIEKGYDVYEENERINYPYNKMFRKSGNDNGIFGVLAYYLDLAVKSNNLDITDVDSKNNPLNNVSNILRKIANIEKKYTTHITTNAFRDGSKSIYGLTPNKMALQTMLNLKTDEDYRNKKSNLSFDGNSFVLQLLKSDIDFRDKFFIDHLGINAIKELGTKLYQDNELVSLSNVDHELIKLGMLQDIQQGEVKTKKVTVNGKVYNLDLRIGRMFFPTMSDKKTMLDLVTAVLNLKKGRDLLVQGEEVILSDDILNFMFSQVVEPELKRMINHHKRAKQLGVSPDTLNNQKAYNKGAQIFHFIPEMNNIRVVDNIRLPHFIAENADKLDAITYDSLLSEIKDSVFDLLQRTLKNEVDNKIKSWEVYLDKEANKLNFFNKKYIDRFDEKDTNLLMKYAAYDYIVNSFIANANMYMLFAGDIANYSQDKAFKEKDFVDGKPYLAKEDSAYSKIQKDIISINTGKRLAMLIAPGKSLYNSINDDYVQLFLKDRVSNTNNIEFLVELYYGKDALTKEVKDNIEILNNSSNSAEINNARKYLSDKFEDISDYFEIETTDAQEYTTAKEALDILFRQGRLHSTTYKTLSEKIEKQKEYDINNQPIPEEFLLTDKEIKLVFNPIKPVVTGSIIDEVNDVNRIMYIKSSSFPLLPQLTKGTELDKLRIAMEDLQNRTGKNVRASYDTANKVGSVLSKNQIEIWDEQGNFKGIDTKTIAKQLNEGNSLSAMVLSRSNFRIQQDVPFKSGKRTEDTVSIGTQMMKVIFGDGIKQIKGKVFDLNGEKLTGEELYTRYCETFDKWISNEKTQLYKQLDINESTGISNDPKTTAKKLQAILQEEAIKRNYSQQDIDALSLEEDGSFTVPLWLSPNSNRYEALLNAIVANRLINLKLPGNSYVAASEEGFRQKVDEAIQSGNIVYTSKWTGEIKAATYDENGILQKAQALVPSKFRNKEGKLIDLIKDGYATKNEKGNWVLDESKIDKELLSISSFRIPTSGHVSLAQIEIVGFLPFESGDMIVIPKNFTKQKGLDYDVDKENTYALWTTIDENGDIRVLDTNNSNNNSKTLTKLYQNEIIKIYSSILGNSDKEVQKKINKVLSMDFARKQADIIQSKTDNTDNTYFSPLSDEYQKYKMGLGAAGKSGIGVYSNYVVLHNLIQQANNTIRLMQRVPDEESGKLVRKELRIRIGNLVSDGVLGKIQTLDGDRTIGEVLAERQNTATDNEKEQIMGRVGVNDLTINIDSLLTALGFDKVSLKDGTKMSIPYLLLSQPIIKDYVSMIRDTRSSISDYDKDAETKVIYQLLSKYGGALFFDEVTQNQIDILSADNETIDGLRSYLTGDNLFQSLSETDNKSFNIIQQVALQLFLSVKTYADEFVTIQSRLNIQRSGLGKSVFEMLEKYNNVSKMQYNDKVDNVSALVGDFISEEEFFGSSISDLKERGYTIFNNFAVKPNNPVGSIIVNSTKAAYELWSDFFPHQHKIIENTMEEIISIISDEDVNESKRIQIKFEVMQEIKKYLFSSEKLGLFSGDAQAERYRLFFDKNNNNTSLANYLSSIKDLPDISSNKLLSSFNYKLNKDGNPSLISYDNTKGEDTNEEYKYLALVELMDKKSPLPDFNGEPYDTRKLARDLVIYSFLQGGIQKATEFVKYIPISLLKETGFASVSRQWQKAAAIAKDTKNAIYVKTASGDVIELWEAMLGTPSGEWEVSRFVKQYVQHNPKKIQKVDVNKVINKEYKNGNKLANLDSFDIPNEKPKKFVSIYNPDLQGSKFQLYQYNGNKYVRINTLGTSGMSEYSIRNQDVRTNIGPQNNMNVQTKAPLSNTNNTQDYFNISSGNTTEIINEIINSNISGFSEVAKLLLPFINNNVKIVVGTVNGGKSRAKYLNQTSTIVIDSNYMKLSSTSKEELARTILHELSHALTQTELDKYFNPDGSFKEGYSLNNTPFYINKLHRVFNEMVNKLGPKIEEFKQWYQSNPGQVRNQEDRILYAGMDIREFAAMVFTEPELQKVMNDIKFKGTDKTIWQQFLETLKEIFKVIGLDIKKDSIAAHAFDSVFGVINSQQSNNSSKFDIQNEINKAQDELNDSDNLEIIATLEPAYSSELLEISDNIRKINFKKGNC